VYSEDAQEFVRGLNIELIDGNRLRKMIDQARSQPKVAPLIMKESHKSIPKCPKCGEEMKKRFSRGKESMPVRNFGDVLLSQSAMAPYLPKKILLANV
jgi:hypothetical protein